MVKREQSLQTILGLKNFPLLKTAVCAGFLLFPSISKGANFSNSAYAVFDFNSYQVLESKNLNTQRPIASVTKLMTAVVYLEEMQKAGLSKKYCSTKIQKDDYDYIKATNTRLPKGVDIPCQELLKATLVNSDNYAAHALSHATHLTKAQFILAMNRKAQRLGMTKTKFVDSSGLSAQNVSTVSDLTKLIFHSQSYPEIVQFSQAENVNVKAGARNLTMRNTNALVRENRFNTIVSKTGYTKEAGYNLAYMALCQDGRLMSVVSLNNKNSFSRMKFTQEMLEKHDCH